MKHESQRDFGKRLFKKYFLPFKEIAFENLEITEECKRENKNTPISLDQEVPVAGVWAWRTVSLTTTKI